MEITIKNTSHYPTAYLKHLIDFVVQYTGKDNFKHYCYTFYIRNRSEFGSWSGRSYSSYQRLNLNGKIRDRYNWPYTHKDRRFVHAEKQTLLNRTELILYLIGHETYHSIDKTKTIGNNSRCEFLANDFGYKIVKKYREVKHTLWRKLFKEVRKERKKQKQVELKEQKEKARELQKKETFKRRIAKAEQKKKEIKKFKRTPGYQLENNTKLMLKWKKQKEHCEKMIKKYNKKVKYYQRRVEQQNV